MLRAPAVMLARELSVFARKRSYAPLGESRFKLVPRKAYNAFIAVVFVNMAAF